MSDQALEHLPDQLRELRAERRWTQADLARELGTTPQTVSRWEQGSPPQPGLRRRLDALLRAGGADASRVIEFPTLWAAPDDADLAEQQLRNSAIAAVAARVGNGVAVSPGEVILLRSLLAAVGIGWQDE